MKVKVYFNHCDLKTQMQSPQILQFINDKDPYDEVMTWNDIIMDEKYCLRELTQIKSNGTH